LQQILHSKYLDYFSSSHDQYPRSQTTCFLMCLCFGRRIFLRYIILLFDCSKVSLFFIAFFATRHDTCFGSFGQGDLNVLPICFVSNTLFLNIYLTCVTSIARHASICGDVILNEAVGKSKIIWRYLWMTLRLLSRIFVQNPSKCWHAIEDSTTCCWYYISEEFRLHSNICQTFLPLSRAWHKCYVWRQVMLIMFLLSIVLSHFFLSQRICRVWSLTFFIS